MLLGSTGSWVGSSMTICSRAQSQLNGLVAEQQGHSPLLSAGVPTDSKMPIRRGSPSILTSRGQQSGQETCPPILRSMQLLDAA